ncbi:segregation and condensation protein A [Lentilactobacillus buchneri]|uniref:Segregation and condensation protein A n=1 Tax=Lentilactobacillus buchneri DSM 20057 TaxID=1423728 RepID=A0A4R5NL29_LENBU|nr:segregation/condensation protein A [Lentilactobacillus buchneri]KRK69730.1 segregation and condensation protein A [Lentilactobacillus buchneri DSM 20057]MCT2881859.1 ribulose phosphate epimerase [Lentilactobacillus buchneri]MCT2899562.1 ribulose phosphate epimerase [Lentilactobacillus buchneri]MCT3251706.1 ribulose phosphate epimerase [Lentilactobacillus buchneri]MCT3546294.1 ribulose phosphate epimerase [Lentilactobacillus buchneri]
MPEVKQPELHLNDFDGPLEVLLHLIQESKMDIYDIQISKITEQYMQYIYDAQQLNLEIVGEYFVMAAKLMVIKSKMLLPTITDDQPDEQQADPREELVSQLLNYKRYKLVAASMKKREMKRRESFTRSELSVPPTKAELIQPSPFNSGDIMASYVDALKHFKYNQPMSTVIHEWSFTIEGQSQRVRELLNQTDNRISFDKLVANSTQTEEVVTDFLAILEMAKYNEVQLNQPTVQSTIEIRKGPGYLDQ